MDAEKINGHKRSENKYNSLHVFNSKKRSQNFKNHRYITIYTNYQGLQMYMNEKFNY